MSRNWGIKATLIINFVASLSIYIGRMVIFFQYKSTREEKSDDYDGAYLILYVLLIIVILLFPVIHSIIVLLIWRKRVQTKKLQYAVVYQQDQSINPNE